MIDAQEIIKQAGQLQDTVTAYRRTIHADPELSYQEHRTAAFIRSVLEGEGIECRSIAGTGVLARIEGEGDLSEAVVLRADIDALPVHEKNGFGFASKNEGVMHACGHDVHAAALLGAMTILKGMQSKIRGTVFGLFQPGEECCPGGATLVLKEEPFKDYKIRAFIGEHVDPELPTGTFGFREGKYMASSDEIRITVNGEGGHAAMPQKLKDPVVASAAIITALQQIVSRNNDPQTPSVLSIGKVIADGATNVVPDKVEMEGTFRTFEEMWRGEAKQLIRNIAVSTANAYGVSALVDINDGYPCVVNDPEITRRARAAIESVFGSDCTVALELRPTAEDFGFYTQVYPSVFFRLGVGGVDGEGDVGKLHTSCFNPDEKALSYGVTALTYLALSF